MFDATRFRYKLARLHKQRRDIDKLAARKTAELRKKGATKKEIEDAEQPLWIEGAVIYDEIHKAHTDYLISVATRLIVPLPTWDDARCEESIGGFRYLNANGISELRAAIRTEQKLRTERILVWLPALAAVTGLIGALTGLIAIVRHG